MAVNTFFASMPSKALLGVFLGLKQSLKPNTHICALKRKEDTKKSAGYILGPILRVPTCGSLPTICHTRCPPQPLV